MNWDKYSADDTPHEHRLGNSYADFWADKAADMAEVPWAEVNVTGIYDGMAWKIRKRIIAICQNYIPHTPYAKHEREPTATTKQILESRDRNNAGITINPRGLIFLGPNYENITKLNPEKSPLIRI